LRFSVNDVETLVFSILLLRQSSTTFGENWGLTLSRKMKWLREKINSQLFKLKYWTLIFLIFFSVSPWLVIFCYYDGPVGNKQLLGVHWTWRCKFIFLQFSLFRTY
jgi:hypothetical protein